jgi:hypothetical protein
VNRLLIALAPALVIALISITVPGQADAQSGADPKAIREANMARMNEQLARELKEKEEAEARQAKESAERLERLTAASRAVAKPGAAANAATSAAATAQPAGPDAKAQAPAAQAPGQPEQRLALVIGNSGYKSGPLTNPVNDARAMAVRLQQFCFAVI